MMGSLKTNGTVALYHYPHLQKAANMYIQETINEFVTPAVTAPSKLLPSIFSFSTLSRDSRTFASAKHALYFQSSWGEALHHERSAGGGRRRSFKEEKVGSKTGSL